MQHTTTAGPRLRTNLRPHGLRTTPQRLWNALVASLLTALLLTSSLFTAYSCTPQVATAASAGSRTNITSIGYPQSPGGATGEDSWSWWNGESHQDSDGNFTFCTQAGFLDQNGTNVPVVDIVGQTVAQRYDDKNADFTWTQERVTEAALALRYCEEHWNGEVNGYDGVIINFQSWLWMYIYAHCHGGGLPRDASKAYYPNQWLVGNMLTDSTVAAIASYIDANRGSYVGLGVLYKKENGTQSSVRFWSEKSQGKLELVKASAKPSATKGNAEYSLEGAVYGVYSDAACTKLVTSMTTDSEGRATSDELTSGWYWVKETTASKGFRLDETAHKAYCAAGETRRVGGDAELSEPVGTGGLSLAKTSASPDATDGNNNYSLTGAVYGVYSDSACTKLAATMETDANGEATTEGLLAGQYYVKETASPKGYKLDESVYPVYVSVGKVTKVNDGTVKDAPGTGWLELTKSSADAAVTSGNSCYSLEGAVFQVKNAKGATVGELTTKADGTTNKLEVTAGTYTVTETTAPRGYKLNATPKTVTVSVGKTTTVDFKDEPLADSVGFALQKLDAQGAEASNWNAQGAATLAGAQFTVKFYKGFYASESELPKNADRAWVVEAKLIDGKLRALLSNACKVSGDAWYAYDSKSDRACLPLGTVAVQETAAPSGYQASDTSIHIAQVVQDDSAADGTAINKVGDWQASFDQEDAGAGLAIADQVKRGGVSVQKLDSQTGSVPEGDASLAGIEFDIVNNNEGSVYVNSTWYGPGEHIKGLLVTNDEGFAATAADALPYGSYTVAEVSTNGSMLNTSEAQSVTVAEDGKTYALEFADDVVRGGVYVQKTDKESGLASPLGAATLAGIEFELVNASVESVVVSGVSYEPGAVISSLPLAGGGTGRLVTDEHGYAATAADALPYGSYTVREAKTNGSYLLTDGEAHAFQIRENSTVVNGVAETDGGTVADQVRRGDLAFNKKAEDTGERLAHVAFELVSQTTGESHVVVTDANGYFSSSAEWNAHTQRTNGNDWALEAEDTIDGSLLDDEAGTWFGLTSEGGTTTADDALGALPYDTYTLKELRCTANVGRALVTTTVTVARNGSTVDYGTIDDPDPAKVSIETWAYDAADGDAYLGAGLATVADKVSYTGLVAGNAYTLETEIVGSESGETLATGSASFTPEEKDGFTIVEVPVSTLELGGKTLTVLERLYDADGALMAEHASIDDPEQQVRVLEPTLATVAADASDGSKQLTSDPEARIEDTVSYTNLVPGAEYELKGTLMLKTRDENGNVAAEELKGSDGMAVAASVTFVPEQANGTTAVEFSLDASALADGTQLVAFEELWLGSELVASHADASDLGQTVTVQRPSIATYAADALDLDKSIAVDDASTIVDTVSYEGLVPGKEYALTATLMQRSTEEAAVDAEGEPVSATATFVPESPSGSTAVEVVFDSRSLADGEELVVFESLTRNGAEVASHVSIDDAAQIVQMARPKIHTTAADAADGDRLVSPDDESTVVDAVSYEGLVPGKEYVLAGTLVNKSTGEPLANADGEDVAATTTFTPEESQGTAEVAFVFDSRSIEDGTTLVAFESLLRAGVEIAAHADIDDEAQAVTVDFPTIATTAADSLDADKSVSPDDETRIVDTVAYAGLVPGKEYTVKGTLILKACDEDGVVQAEPVTDADGNAVTAEATFTPETPDGSVDIEFVFDSRLMPRGAEVVAFESLERAGVEVAVHADIEDQNQTVTVDFPELATTAVDSLDGNKTVSPDDESKVVDIVSYQGLVPGKEYVLSGTLMSKSTGEPLTGADGKAVAATATFVPEAADGTAELAFAFDSRALRDGAQLVAFETLLRAGAEVAAHTDLNDEGQTVTVMRPELATLAADGHDGDKTLVADAMAKIVDTVSYQGLIPGKEYALEGTLHAKRANDDGSVTDSVLMVNGEPVTAFATFTPEAADGETSVVFEFDASGIAHGTELVAFESLKRAGLEVAAHADISDEAQAVSVVRTAIGTSAADALDGNKVVVAGGSATIGDKVMYAGALTGQSYTLMGLLVNASTGLPVLAGDGAESVSQDELIAFTLSLAEALGVPAEATGATEGALIEYGAAEADAQANLAAANELLSANARIASLMVRSSAAIEPQIESGTADMAFSLDASSIIDREAGTAEDVTVFELMLKGSADSGAGVLPVAAAHADLTSTAQTVTVAPSAISTTAVNKADGSHKIIAGKGSSIIDTVTYQGLVPGKEYVLKATLMDKSSGKTLESGGKAVSAELRFTPNSADGSVDIELGEFDSSDLGGRTLVAFEELWKQENGSNALVAEHKDLNDASQSVSVEGAPANGGGTAFSKTGGTMAGMVVAMILLAAVACAASWYARQSRTAPRRQTRRVGTKRSPRV